MINIIDKSSKCLYLTILKEAELKMTLKEELHALQHQNFDLVFSDPTYKALFNLDRLHHDLACRCQHAAIDGASSVSFSLNEVQEQVMNLKVADKITAKIIAETPDDYPTDPDQDTALNDFYNQINKQMTAAQKIEHKLIQAINAWASDNELTINYRKDYPLDAPRQTIVTIWW